MREVSDEQQKLLRQTSEAHVHDLRRRLLDLRTGNRLLHFPHAARGRNYVRAVDEVPELLHKKLVDGRSLRILPLPELPGVTPEAGLTNDDEAALAATSTPTVEQLARQAGIDPSYTLPPLDAQRPRRHADDALQTLLLPELHQKTLARIADNSRLSQEEQGIHTLFAAFGFLEWYEQGEQKDTARHAPLLLVPLKLQRERKAGRYEYAVSAHDEEADVNLALSERLARDFGIALPAWDDDGELADYFARVTAAIADQPRWKLQRWVTVSNFSFARIAMYQDLDGEGWPEDHAPHAHATFRALTVDRTHEAPASFHDDPALPALADGMETLVLDADSTQAAAILEAMQQRNLVIKGPPGTGKSQTIANLIATSLARGQRVLFVAEKLAALEVVKARLDRAGLGDFCLELHSHRGTRKAVLETVATRLELRLSAPRELDALRDRSAALRTQLASYTDAINDSTGALGSSLHSLIWQRESCRAACGTFLPALERLRVSQVAALRQPELDAVRHLLRGFQQVARDRERAFAGQTTSLWFELTRPVQSDVPSEPSEDTLLALIERAQASSEAVRRALVGALGPSLADPLALGQARPLQALLRALGSDVPLEGPLLTRLDTPSARATVHSTLQLLSRRASLQASLAQRCGDLTSATQALSGLRVAAHTLTKLGIDDSLAAARRAAMQRMQTLDACERDTARLSELMRFAGLHEPDDAQTVLTMQSAVEALQEAPRELLRTLRAAPALAREHGAAALRKLAAEGDALRAEREALDQRIVRGRDDTQLRERAHEYALALRRPWWLAWLFRVFWAARGLHTRVAREPGRPAREMADDLLQAQRVLDGLAQFEARSDAALLCGAEFRGVDTDFPSLIAANAWAEGVSSRFARIHGAAAVAREFLLRGELAQLDTFRQEVSLSSLEPFWQLAARAKQREQTLSQTVAVERARDGEVLSALDVLAAVDLDAHLPIDGVSRTLDEIGELSALEQQLDAARGELATLGLPDDPRAHDLAQLDLTLRASELATQRALPLDVLAAVATPSAREALAFAVDEPLQRLESDYAALSAAGLSHAAGRLERLPSPVALSLLQQALAARPLLRAQLRYLAERARALQTFAAPVIEASLRGEVPLAQLVEASEFLLYGELLQLAIEAQPALRERNGSELASIADQFRALDREVLQQQARAIAHGLGRSPIAEGVASGKKSEWTELALIKHELSKKIRHLPLRQLIRRAGTALATLKPCFMMSPLTVAQFLPQLADQFDLLVIDEASQMRPEDALGALIRAKRAVVVGDPKQLPPTSFFHRLESTDEDEASSGEWGERDETIDQESILDLGVASFGDTRDLRWHYRSRHPSLIAYSNEHFYDGRLMVFPAPLDPRANRGMQFVYTGGEYLSSLNAMEAERIALGVQRHVRLNPQLTLGVVAMNQQQKELIRQKIDDLADESVRGFVDAANQAQPFFVKSLENVQGDERDVIFVSLTYGPDPVSKKVRQNFGPINSQYGARRLNVLFTRARERLVLFSSLRAEDVRVEAGASPGLVALRGFLSYAERGAQLAASSSEAAPDGPFAGVVRGFLEQAGYQVVARVGVQGFFVDLAVLAKDGSGVSCGIECDGADYHAQRSVRDRDRLRHELLESQGWNLVRVWSIDWFRNPAAARERLLHDVAEACKA